MTSIDEIKQAEAANITFEAIQRFAEAVAGEYNYNPGDDLTEFVEGIGGEVIYEDTLSPHHGDGSLVVRKIKDFDVILPYHTGPLRDRFTIAHELGHYFVHYLYAQKGQGQMKAARLGSGRVEQEANAFAASLLMPKAKFKEAFQGFDGQLALVSDYFQVSMLASKIRAESLQLKK